MRVILVGSDLEENLGLGMIAAAAETAGHTVRIVPFCEPAQQQTVAAAILAASPEVVGLSIQFQHRSHEFLALARDLRARGYAGHITAGGQFPTLAFADVLATQNGLSSVVLHDGEASFVELLGALAGERPLDTVPGIALRDEGGLPLRTAGRRLVDDLDTLPFPKRYRRHTLHVGIPFIPIMGGRGCWGRCSFCSITSTYRDARAYGGGKMLRYRSPENVAEEMAGLWKETAGKAIFCFHDDNFLLPRPDASLRRLRAIRQALDQRGVGPVGLIGKCRPDTLTPELAQMLRALGVVRLYIGVENIAERGALHLGRGVAIERVHQALEACSEAGIFACYNLLIFEPDSTLDDVAQNIAFVRQHAEHPFNFGRAEPYIGTPLQRGLAAASNLSGTYLGHGYRIKDDRVELLFRICAAAFRQRNYDADGVHNRAMGVGYTAKLLEHFYARDGLPWEDLAAAGRALTRRITTETTTFLEQALLFARLVDLDDADRISQKTALLGLRIAEADRWHHAQLDQFYERARQLAEQPPPAIVAHRDAKAPRKRVARLAQGVALSVMLTAGAQGCDDGRMVVDPDVGPLDGMVVDPDVAPLDAQIPPPDISYVSEDPGVYPLDGMVVDPDVAPLDGKIIHPDIGPWDGMVVDPDVSPLDGMIVDPQPQDLGFTNPPDDMMSPGDAGQTPPPDDATVPEDATPPWDGLSDARDPRPRLLDQWHDTAPSHVTRTTDLPLHDPPAIALSARQDQDEAIHVRLCGGASVMSIRWEGDGAIEGQGKAVRWRPGQAGDQIRVGVRTRGGIAVAALRARDVIRRKPVS